MALFPQDLARVTEVTFLLFDISLHRDFSARNDLPEACVSDLAALTSL